MLPKNRTCLLSATVCVLFAVQSSCTPQRPDPGIGAHLSSAEDVFRLQRVVFIELSDENNDPELAKELTEGCGGTGFRLGIEEKERLDLWRARHEAWETIHRVHKGKETLVVDAAVPISRYPEMIIFSQQLVDEHNIAGYVFGHAGDGNLHVVMTGDPKDKGEWSVLESVNDRTVTRAVELGGTCTGEHGVGIGKRKFMDLEHGEGYELMRHIKELVDPKGLMNPDKIFSLD